MWHPPGAGLLRGELAGVRQSPDHRDALEQGRAPKRGLELAGQVLPGHVHHLVTALLPQEAARDVVDLPLEGDVRRSTVLLVKSSWFCWVQLAQGVDWVTWARSGRGDLERGLPFSVLRLTA